MTWLPHIAQRVFSTPLMISRAKLDVLLSVLGPRLQGEALAPKRTDVASTPLGVSRDGVAVIPVFGTLVRRVCGLEAESGLTSYVGLASELANALDDPSVKAILLDIDSPGGEAGGVFDLADQIYAARQIKPIWSCVSGNAFSAAYALAAATERIYVSRTSGVGSIGVIAMHVDQSQADLQDGMIFTPVFAGAHKNDYSPHSPLTDPARAALQAEVDRVYGLFVDVVARGRGMTVDAVCKTEAASFFGGDGVAVGLADALGTFDDAMDALVVSSLNTNRKDLLMAKQEQLPEPEAKEPLPDLEAVRAEVAEKAKTEAMAYVAEVHELCALAGVPDKAAAFVSKGVSVHDVRQSLLAAKAEEADATAIAGQAPLPKPTETPTIDTAAIYQARNNQQGR